MGSSVDDQDRNNREGTKITKSGVIFFRNLRVLRAFVVKGPELFP
jgi:hypothetical protein